MSRIGEIKTEIDVDPLGRVYSGMDDLQVADSANTKDRPVDLSSLSSTAVINAIDKTQWDALVQADRDRIWNLIHMGDLNPFGIEEKIFVDVFGVATATIVNLAALRRTTNAQTRGQELGLGAIQESEVIRARSLP